MKGYVYCTRPSFDTQRAYVHCAHAVVTCMTCVCTVYMCVYTPRTLNYVVVCRGLTSQHAAAETLARTLHTRLDRVYSSLHAANTLQATVPDMLAHDGA
jgi:hypothetical protein